MENARHNTLVLIIIVIAGSILPAGNALGGLQAINKFVKSYRFSYFFLKICAFHHYLFKFLFGSFKSLIESI